MAEVTKRCSPSQPDVIFVVMNALVKFYEDDLIAKRNVTAMSLMIAMPYAHSVGLSYPNRLVIANQNARAFGLSSILAKQRMRTKLSRSRMAAAIWLSSTRHLYFSECSASWPPPSCPLWPSTSRVTFRGNS